MNSEDITLLSCPSIDPGAPAFPLAIAEEALALLGAFTDQDIEEISFRTTLLLAYAREAGYAALATVSLALLEEVNGLAQPWREEEESRIGLLLEQVIAATAGIVAPVNHAWPNDPSQ